MGCPKTNHGHQGSDTGDGHGGDISACASRSCHPWNAAVVSAFWALDVPIQCCLFVCSAEKTEVAITSLIIAGSLKFAPAAAPVAFYLISKENEKDAAADPPASRIVSGGTQTAGGESVVQDPRGISSSVRHRRAHKGPRTWLF